MTRAARWTVGVLAGVAGLVGLLALAVELPPELGVEPPEGFNTPQGAVLYGTLPPELSESSGVAVSRNQPGVIWTHNDSGNDQILFAIDSTGRVLGRFEVDGVRLRDWEDLAIGRCPEGAHSQVDASCLYLSDTGDNMRRRSEGRIHVVVEPIVDGEEEIVQVVRTIRVTYGQPYDVEALAVDTAGNLFLANKGPGEPVKLMRVPAAGLAMTDQAVMVEEVAELDVVPMRFLGRLVTGAAISADGARLVVRTYIELLFYRFGPDGMPISEGPPCFLGLLEPQGEAVDFLNEQTVLVTSEALAGRPGTIYGITCH